MQRAPAPPRTRAGPVAVRSLGRWTAVFVGLSTAVTVVGAAVSWRLVALLDGSGDAPPAAADRWDDVFSYQAPLDLALRAAAVAMVAIWLHRVRVNAESFGVDAFRRAARWAVAGWIVPVVNLWFPKQVMDDVWMASDPGRPAEATDVRRVRGPLVVLTWWVCWMVSVVGSLVWLNRPWVMDAEQALTAYRAAAWSGPFVAAAGVLLVLIVLRVSRWQGERVRTLDRLRRQDLAA